MHKSGVAQDTACRTHSKTAADTVIPVERIERAIYLIRGQKVLLDRDLAVLYGVETRVLNQAVTRNIRCFPSDFMFELTREEIRNISQNMICLVPYKSTTAITNKLFTTNIPS